MSLNRKDWLKIAGLLGLGATGFGLAGMGPLAGLLGGATTGTAAGAIGAGTAGTATTGLSAVPALETAALASQVPAATQAAANIAAPLNFAGSMLEGAAKGAGTVSKVAAPMQAMGLLGQPAPSPMPSAPLMPQMAPQPPQDPNYGYPAPSGGMKPPGMSQQEWDALDPVKKQELIQKMMMGRLA